MQNQFKYSSGLVHGTYQFQYQHKPKPIQYGFRYATGACHGAYKFTYGETHKPIYVESGIHQYTYWGKEIHTFDNANQFINAYCPINLLPTIHLMKQALKSIEKIEVHQMGKLESVKPIYTTPSSCAYRKSDKQIHQQSKGFYVDRLKEQLAIFDSQKNLIGVTAEIKVTDIAYFLTLLNDLKLAIEQSMCLSYSQVAENVLETAIFIRSIKYKLGSVESDISANKPYASIEDVKIYCSSRSPKHTVQLIETLHHETDNQKNMQLLNDLNQLVSLRDFHELINELKNITLDRTSLIDTTIEQAYSFKKHKFKDGLNLFHTKRFAHKNLRLNTNQVKYLKKKIIDFRVSQEVGVERNFEKEVFHNISRYLQRQLLKDALNNVVSQQLMKLPIKHIEKQAHELFMTKPCLKEVTAKEMAAYLIKYNVNELTNELHTLLANSDRIMIQNTVTNYLDKVYEATRLLTLKSKEHHLECITQYALDIDQHIQTLSDSMKDCTTDELIQFVTETLRTFAQLEHPQELDMLSKELQKVETFLLHKELLIQIEESENTLKLYKRFWIVGNSDFKDLMILPAHDYPYQDEPIIEDIELMPENYHVVYPNEFYKRIDRHPIPNGTELAPNEIGISINILIELINIFIMMWCKFTPAFWGWTGTQAVIGMVDSIYEFITLETSREQQQQSDVQEQYDRAYKWLRWEGEQMALKARHDPGLKGNYYVGLMLEELIYYMQDHHFDIMPIFEDVNKMDEWRNMFDRNVNKDIKFVLDKVKGIRHKILEKEVRPYES